MNHPRINRWHCHAVVLSAALLLLPQASLARNDNVGIADVDPVDVAIVGPMIGTSFAVGAQFRTGVHAALQHLTDGSLLGRPIRITEYNDSCDRDIAEKLALDLVQRPPAVVIGHSCSAATLITAPIYTRHDVLQISPASTSPAITEMGITTLFRLIGRDDQQGRLVAERIRTQYAGKKVGILRFATDYSFSLTKSAMDALARQGIEMVVVDSLASSTSYLTEISKLTEAGAEVVYVVGSGLDGGVIARQVDQTGSPFELIGSDTLVSTTFTDTAGAAGDGIPFLFPPDGISLQETDTTRGAIAAIRAMGVETDGYTMLSYAAAEVWLEGVRRAGTTNAEAVAEALRRAPMSTVLGNVSFDHKGDIQTEYPAYSWFTWQEGVRVPID